MTDRLSAEAQRLCTTTTDLINWILESRPDLSDSPQILYVTKRIARVREAMSQEFDMAAALEDAAMRGRITDPATSAKAADVAKLRAGSQKQKLAAVYFEHGEGLTAEEAVLLAGLSRTGSALHQVLDLKASGALRATGRERKTGSGVLAEVLVMTIAARDAWHARYGAPVPAEVLSIFGDAVENA